MTFPKFRTFPSLQEANKVWRKENKRMLKISGFNGSLAYVDIVYFFESNVYVVLYGYEMDEENDKCKLDWSCQGIDWELVSLM